LYDKKPDKENQAMDCPFCGKEMKTGTIPSGVKWVEDDTFESVPLCGALFGRTPKSFFCPGCRQIILPVPEVEGALEFLERKLGAAGEKIETAKKQWEARRTEERKETERKKFGEKDPWEL